MQKEYIINLKFGDQRWQVWLVGEDSQEAKKEWENSLQGLEEVGENSSSPQEFFDNAIRYFKKNGFKRIAR